MKLTLTQICKDALENLKRLKPLVEPYIDEWVVVFPPGDPAIAWAKKNGIKAVVKDFTQPIEPEVIGKMREEGLEVDPDYRLFNFAAARNESLKHATGDYVLWLDADDEPIGLDKIQEFIEKNPETDVFHAIYDYARDEEGNRASDHTRERVIKNNGVFEWKGSSLGLIHETLIAKEGKSYLRLDFPEDVYVKHHSDHIEASSERNFIALLYEYIKTEGEDPRNTFYLGIEFFNRKLYENCIKTLLEFEEKSGSQEDKYYGWLKIAEAYHMLGKNQSGRNAYYAAIDEMPNYPNAYLGLGESYHKEENWAKSTDFILTGLNKKMPGVKHGLDKMMFTFRPAVYLALNYTQLGKTTDAYKWFNIAAQMNPKHPWIQDNAKLFEDTKNLDEYVRSFVKLGQLSQKLYPKTLFKLAEVVPDELMSQELLMDFKWRYTRPKIWPDNSVVFFCSSAFEDWGPESLLKGCGGSEEAIIQLTKRLVKLGWDVTVFNNCIKEGVVDGVKWVRFERFNPRDIFNILVGWRNNPFTEPKVANKKFIDMHDVVTEKQYYAPEYLKGVKLMVKSQFHRTTLPHLPDDQFIIIPNGISLDQFPKTEKVKNNLVWSSSYDRGLDNLLNMWPDIKKEVPDATFDVYYGFQLYDSTPWGRTPKGQAWKHEMEELLKHDGVIDHGRVGSDEVAKAYLKADIWAYPTEFPEISCITAMKAQAAGAIPVCTDYAALKETVKGGIIIPGSINNPDVQSQFKRELIALMKDDKRKKELRAGLNVDEFSWDAVANMWSEEFKK